MVRKEIESFTGEEREELYQVLRKTEERLTNRLIELKQQVNKNSEDLRVILVDRVQSTARREGANRGAMAGGGVAAFGSLVLWLLENL